MAETLWSPTQDPCDEDILDEDGQPGQLSAFTSPSNSGLKDIVTVCSNSWGEWTGQLPARRAGGLNGLRGEELDDILNVTPEATFLHELTHV